MILHQVAGGSTPAAWLPPETVRYTTKVAGGLTPMSWLLHENSMTHNQSGWGSTPSFCVSPEKQNNQSFYRPIVSSRTPTLSFLLCSLAFLAADQMMC